MNLVSKLLDEPQGGLISSKLFLISVNDMVNCYRINNCVLYEDDTSLYMSSSDIINLYEKVNELHANYKCWFDSNMFTLNVQETHKMVFHRK